MTVAELIAILKNHDPAAEVVVGAYHDPGVAFRVIELFFDDVRAVAMREVSFERTGFDPDHGAKLYEVDDEGPVSGVEIG